MLVAVLIFAPTAGHTLEFEADSLKIDDKTGRAILTGNVKAWDDTGVIRSERLIIRYRPKGDTVTSYEAFGNVRIDRGDINARSEYAFRDARADTLFLQEDAYVKRGNNEFWADRINVDLKTSQVRMSGRVRGNLRSRTGQSTGS